jgi:methylated-DNA-[protein]-cysteine S-methyltransferase
MTPASQRVVETPLGHMLLRARGGALTGAWFLDQADCPAGADGDADANGKASGDVDWKASGDGNLKASSDANWKASSDGNGTTSRDRNGNASSDSPLASVPASRRAMPLDDHGDAAFPDRAPDVAVLDQAALELAEYFDGRRRAFTLAMATQGTPFQRRVWDALRDVPFGSLESYGALAGRCAQIAAVRAVAQAVGRNPISIFIPCHRIVGSDSALTGFGGGLARKQALLALEGHAYATPDPGARRATADSRQGTLW